MSTGVSSEGYTISTAHIEDFADMDEEPEDDNDMESFGPGGNSHASPFVPVNKSKKGKNKKKKIKFLDKIKNMTMGRNKRKRKDGEEEIGSEKEIQDTKTGKIQSHGTEPNSKKSRLTTDPSQSGREIQKDGSGFGQRGSRGRGDHGHESFQRSTNSGGMPGQSPRGGDQNNRGGGKGRGRGGTGFLNPFRRREAEGRSITFK